MNNDWSLRLLRVGKRERPSGWGGSLPGALGRRHAGRGAGRPAASGPPLPAPRPGSRPTGGRRVRRPPPGVPLRSLPMPGRHSGRLGPHPPGVLRTQRRGLAPPSSGAGRWTLRASHSAPPLQPASPAPTPDLAWVSVSFPLRHTSTWPQGLSSPAPITPPLYHPVPLPLSNAFSRPASCFEPRGPCHLPDLHPPPLGPCGTHPQAPLLHPPGLSFQQSRTPMPTAFETHFLHSTPSWQEPTPL